MSSAVGQGIGLPLHLVRLISQSLPIGGFSYSRGLEFAAEAGWVKDEAGARDWILGTLQDSFVPLDGARFLRMMAALTANAHEAFLEQDVWLAAARESRELQQEDRRMAEALMTLLRDLGAVKEDLPARSYAAAFALAAHHWQVDPLQALKGLMWAIVDGQVAAAIRLVRIGQTAGQRILIEAVPVIEQGALRAVAIGDDDIGNVSVRVAMASAWHETQYSRLFRS